MICEHPWIISVVVKHWSGEWLEYRCALCGTGMGHIKIQSSEESVKNA